MFRRGAITGPVPEEITSLLDRLGNNNGRESVDRLVPLVYAELRKMARRYLSRERADHTLQPTALVNEAYLRLAHKPERNFQNRDHFLAIAAHTMRQILVDHSRAHGSQKRGGGVENLSSDLTDIIQRQDYGQIVLIDQALSRLQEHDPRQAAIVELRFFGGLTEDEISQVMGISVRTVKRDWKFARAWLHREMTS